MTSEKSSSKLKRLLSRPFHQQLNFLRNLPARFVCMAYYPLVFRSFGRKSLLVRPTAIEYPQYIEIGNSVSIRDGVRLEAVPNRKTSPLLQIGDHVNIEQNVHIVCHNRVTIGANVSITAFCAIVDTSHPFDDVPLALKVGDLIADDDAFVDIGEGSFLGIGTIVLPNVRIGKGCVIGAHSVVTRDIPDFSVAAGNPAKVLRSIRRT